jgi:hypothetical protein
MALANKLSSRFTVVRIGVSIRLHQLYHHLMRDSIRQSPPAVEPIFSARYVRFQKISASLSSGCLGRNLPFLEEIIELRTGAGTEFTHGADFGCPIAND